MDVSIYVQINQQIYVYMIYVDVYVYVFSPSQNIQAAGPVDHASLPVLHHLAVRFTILALALLDC